MVGGNVIEVIDLPEKNRVWINTEDGGDKCAIYVERDAKARTVSEGDSVWWQGREAMWTPEFSRKKHTGGKSGVDYDIRLKRIGYSGVKRPVHNAELSDRASKT